MIRTFSVLLVLSYLFQTRPGNAAESVADCQRLLTTGQYEKCLTATSAAIEERSYGEDWPVLKAQCEIALGKYPEALQTVVGGIERYAWSVRLRELEYECALANGHREQAAEALKQVEKLVSVASWRYTDADDLVSLGHVALWLGADAKAVQEGFFERARKNYTNRADGFLAAGQLALDKGDAAFAAELLTPAANDFPENPDVLFLLSKALQTADSEKSAELLQRTLEINPNHKGALLHVTEKQIDAEDYDEAEATIQKLLAVNPHLPEAHALQSVIEHLQNHMETAAESRAAAMKFSTVNPGVNHLIGRKLSQKYRFAEGAEFQRKAIESDPEFIPAKKQLAQDLLRLGKEEEGWALAEQAHEEDGYDTTLFNLLQLKDSLDRFTDVSSEHFRVRMETQEAAVYGPRVLALLERAWTDLSLRYEFTPEHPVVVEIYPRADDFAVRTFGIPDVAGFLGVCFGKVITANSPATRRDQPTSWESILWHEFCHVVTLQKTGNKIPRWLSEGISVFEERRAQAGWGQRMDATFRDRILAGNVTPISELSSAFLTARTGEDMNFAYYESSMVVEHLVELHGLAALNGVLQDLHAGVQINDAIDRHAGGIETLEQSFTAYLTEEAQRFASGVDFSDDALLTAAPTDAASVQQFLETHPQNFPAMLMQASLLMKEGRTEKAETILKRLVELVPENASVDGPRRLLAKLYQDAGRPESEAAVLTDHLQRSADDLAAALRLQELCENANKPERVIEMGNTIFAIDPFQASAIHRTLNAAESLEKTDVAVAQLRSLLQLQPDDAPRLHYRIARFLSQTDPVQARRHVLLALENAPRFRDAHQLLLQLANESMPQVP